MNEGASKSSTWSKEQEAYLDFLAAGKLDRDGKKITREKFAELIGVHFTTLYRWQGMPGFKEELFERSLGRRVDYLPQMIDAQVLKAIGTPDKRNGDTTAFMALMRQYSLLKADKVDSTSTLNGGIQISYGPPVEAIQPTPEATGSTPE